MRSSSLGNTSTSESEHAQSADSRKPRTRSTGIPHPSHTSSRERQREHSLWNCRTHGKASYTPESRQPDSRFLRETSYPVPKPAPCRAERSSNRTIEVACECKARSSEEKVHRGISPLGRQSLVRENSGV